jgi:hypothetical protein
VKNWSRRKILITQSKDNIHTQHIEFSGPAVEIPTLAALSREKSDAAAIYLGHSSCVMKCYFGMERITEQHNRSENIQAD